MNLESITILWSPRQKAFHRETLKETLKTGCEALISGAPVDYILLGVFETKAESDAFLEECRQVRAAQVLHPLANDGDEEWENIDVGGKPV